MDRLTRAINLLGGALRGYHVPEFGQLFANDLSAMFYPGLSKPAC